MRLHPCLVAVAAAAAVACHPPHAAPPCTPGDGMPVFRPDTARYRMPTADPGDVHDSAMVVGPPPCPDSTG